MAGNHCQNCQNMEYTVIQCPTIAESELENVLKEDPIRIHVRIRQSLRNHASSAAVLATRLKLAP